MTRRFIAGIATLLALVVAAATGVVVAGYWRTLARHDPNIVLPPVAIPLVLAGIALFSTVSSGGTGKKTGAMVGFSLGSILYLVFPGLQLLLQYEMVRQDGTGFWAVTMLPSIYLGIPLPIIGTLVGFVIGLFVDRKRGRRGVQPVTPPYEA